MRAGEAGDAKKIFLQNGGLDGGRVDWRLGCFRMNFDDGGRLSSLTHILGAEAKVPAHVVITKAYKLFDNHLAHVARVDLKPNTYTFGDFDFEGIHTDFRGLLPVHGKTFKRFGVIASTARDQMSDLADVRLASVKQEKNTVMEPALQTRAVDTMQEAHMALHTKATKSEKSRLVFGVSVIVPSVFFLLAYANANGMSFVDELAFF